MGARVQRWDTHGSLKPAERLDNGWLRCEGRTARVGILQYPKEDGTIVNELVLPEDLFEPASMASARMVPVTSNHPSGLLDSKNARDHQVGSVGENLRPDGDYLVAPLMFTDAKAISEVENGRAQLSWGYSCEVDPPDPALVGRWGQHDGIQRKRIYNHLARVDAARAGDQARVRLDASGNARLQLADASDPVVPLTAPQQTPETPPMPITIRVDGRTFQADDANGHALQTAIDEAVSRARKDAADAGDKLLAGAIERADSAEQQLAAARSNVAANLGRLKRKWDAMKARSMACDECGGSGKVDGVRCDYCDGSGKVRMHDAIKEEPVAAEMEQDAAAMMGEPDGDEDEEQDGMDPPGLIAAEHKDGAQVSKLAKAIAASVKRRRDSMTRIIRRDTAARVALETGARKFLGADAKLDGKSEGEIKALVLGKLKPYFKLDGRGAQDIAIAYELAIGEAPAAASDHADGEGGGGNGNANGERGDAAYFDVAAAQRKYNENLRAATSGKRAS